MALCTARNLLTPSAAAATTTSVRGIRRIPHWEHHIRFDPKEGRKRPCMDVLDRFKRLNNGLWIHGVQGRTTRRYAKDDTWQKSSEYYVTCTREQSMMLDKMMTPFWLRPKHYVDNPYEPYNVRHGINSPRVDYKGRYVRERPKILLEDSTAQKYFDDH
ncbi:putative 39S ribosomal protein L35 [Aphelenchoides avenae]|nr:putative 39S ribosomal protein L35 [Aphelenchus avenae]